MAWHLIRPATERDRYDLNKAAEAFAAEHEMNVHNWLEEEKTQDTVTADDLAWELAWIEEDGWPEADRLNRLWNEKVESLLGPGATGIAYGWVGRGD